MSAHADVAYMRRKDATAWVTRIAEDPDVDAVRTRLDAGDVLSHELAPRPARKQNVAALIGLLATLEAQLMTGDDALPDWATSPARRLRRDDPMDGHSNRDMRQALNDLNHPLRYVRGDY